VDDRLAEVAKSASKFVAAHAAQKMAGFITFLGEDTKENQDKLVVLAKKCGLTIPAGISVDGVAGPPFYKINPDVSLVVYVSRKDIVRANFVFPDPPPEDKAETSKQIQAVLAAALKVLTGR
jgi:hypothetical protein